MSTSPKHSQHVAGVRGDDGFGSCLGGIEILSKPNNRLLTAAVYLPHHCNLMGFLIVVFLINADSFNPQYTAINRIPKAPQMTRA